jgi:hypothetical protein
MDDATTAPEQGSAGDVEPLEGTPDQVVEPEPAEEPVPEAAEEPEPEPEPAEEPEPEPEAAALTLEELVAEIAGSEEAEVPAVTPAPVEGEESAELEEPSEPAETPAETTESIESPAEAAAASTPLLRRLWTRVPFWLLDGLWLAVTVAAMIVLWKAPSATFSDGVPYAILVLGGAAFAFSGVVAGLVVWLVARGRASESERVGLGLTIWTRALAWTAGGVALWWVGLLLLDLHHAGVIG